jgi:hypothetical protein
MKFTIIVFLIFTQTSFGQSSRTMYFNEIGWTIIIPPEFSIIDSGAKATELDKRGVDIVAENTGKRFDYSTLVHLFTAKKDNQTYFIAGYDSTSEINANNWQALDSISSEAGLQTILKIMLFKADTLHSVKVVDGVVFKNTQSNFFITKSETKTVCLLRTYYKKVYLTITYSYDNAESFKEINTMLSTSKFKR